MMKSANNAKTAQEETISSITWIEKRNRESQQDILAENKKKPARDDPNYSHHFCGKYITTSITKYKDECPSCRALGNDDCPPVEEHK